MFVAERLRFGAGTGRNARINGRDAADVLESFRRHTIGVGPSTARYLLAPSLQGLLRVPHATSREAILVLLAAVETR